MEDVAQQFGWTVNHMSTYLLNGHALKGQAKAVLLQAKRTPRRRWPRTLCQVCSGCQLKFKYLIFLGKPIKGVVFNAWMAEVLFDKDTAAGKLARNQELRKYLQQTTGATCMRS